MKKMRDVGVPFYKRSSILLQTYVTQRRLKVEETSSTIEVGEVVVIGDEEEGRDGGDNRSVIKWALGKMEVFY